MQSFTFLPGKNELQGSSLQVTGLCSSGLNLALPLRNNNSLRLLVRSVPPDSPSIILDSDDVSGSSYQIQMFPFAVDYLDHSTISGDPIWVYFETKLEKPELELTSVSETSICGLASISGRFIKSEVYVKYCYIETVVLYYDGTRSWCLEELHPAVYYSIVLHVYTENQRNSSDFLEVTTRPSKPYLRQLDVNKVERTSYMVLEIAEHVYNFDYRILCNGSEKLHESNQFKSYQYDFTSQPEHYGCNFKTWSTVNSAESFRLSFIIGFGVVESVIIDKSDVDDVQLISTYSGLASQLLVQYEIPPSHVYEDYFSTKSMPCSLGAMPVRGVYVEIKVTPIEEDIVGLAYTHVEPFLPHVLNVEPISYSYNEQSPVGECNFQFVGRYDKIEVTSSPYIATFHVIASKF